MILRLTLSFWILGFTSLHASNDSIARLSAALRIELFRIVNEAPTLSPAELKFIFESAAKVHLPADIDFELSGFTDEGKSETRPPNSTALQRFVDRLAPFFLILEKNPDFLNHTNRFSDRNGRSWNLTFRKQEPELAFNASCTETVVHLYRGSHMASRH